jgi:SWI/SNF chromatin-remodeling complex subunit SWI1
MNIHGSTGMMPTGSAPQANPAAVAAFKQQRANFLSSLASMFNNMNRPLPPQLTGIQSAYDPNNTTWKFLEIGGVGCVRIANKDVDLFRLWRLFISAGGSQAVRTLFIYSHPCQSV